MINKLDTFGKIVSSDSYMLSIFKYCRSIANTVYPILITGNTGVGKELMAKAIHDYSRRKGEFVAVNISGVDDNVFTDTLFGHLRGSYTGAISNRAGMVDKASSGTLFLDEIGDLGPTSQVKLLRLLQENEFFPLGSDNLKKSTAVVIAATNRNINILYNDKSFRTDLYYRLTTHHIHIPPLNERKIDIKNLVDTFIEEAAKKCGKKIPSYNDKLINLLCEYAFPGNIRELEAMVYDAVIRATSKQLPFSYFQNKIEKANSIKPPIDQKESSIISSKSSSLAPRDEQNVIDIGPRINRFNLPENSLDLIDLNKKIIKKALEKFKFNKTKTAKYLGLSRYQLRRFN